MTTFIADVCFARCDAQTYTENADSKHEAACKALAHFMADFPGQAMDGINVYAVDNLTKAAAGPPILEIWPDSVVI